MKNRKSMFKKAIALTVALVMCVAMLPTAAFAADAEPPAWDGSIADSIPVVGGIYTISTPAQLAKLAADVNGGINNYSGETVELAANINLGGLAFTPIGNWTSSATRNKHTFQGTFNGKGFTIKNASIVGNDTTKHAGVFGCVTDGGTVQNLYLSGIRVNNTSSLSGGRLWSDASSGIAVGVIENATVTNVHADNSCTVEGVYRTGGIVGSARATESVVSKCTNEATVKGSGDYTGGIVGAAHEVSSTPDQMGTTVSECINSGTVNGTSAVGGIVGYADRAIVDKCTNESTGVITATGNYGTGGIVGCNAYNPQTFLGIVVMSPTVGSKITFCTNKADVAGGYAGGILGAYVVAPGKKQPADRLDCTIAHCTNEGNISGSTGHCGSIFGYQITYADGSADEFINNMYVVISECEFSGTVNNGAAVKTMSKFISD